LPRPFQPLGPDITSYSRQDRPLQHDAPIVSTSNLLLDLDSVASQHRRIICIRRFLFWRCHRPLSAPHHVDCTQSLVCCDLCGDGNCSRNLGRFGRCASQYRVRSYIIHTTGGTLSRVVVTVGACVTVARPTYDQKRVYRSSFARSASHG
jgi:hypothetical protein